MSLQKLATLLQKLPDQEAGQLGKLMAKLIIADSTMNEQVDNTTDEEKEEETADTILDRNSDAFMAIMRSLPERHPLKEAIDILDSSISDVQSNFQNVSQEIKDVLGTETGDDDVDKLKNNSDFAILADMVLTMSSELDELKSFSSTLKGLSSKHSDDEIQPIRHKIQDQKKLKIPEISPEAEP